MRERKEDQHPSAFCLFRSFVLIYGYSDSDAAVSFSRTDCALRRGGGHVSDSGVDVVCMAIRLGREDEGVSGGTKGRHDGTDCEAHRTVSKIR